MTCPRNGSAGIGKYLDEYLYSQFYNAPFRLRSLKKCKAFTQTVPNYTPDLINLSTSSNIAGRYSFVLITGSNFLPNGNTFIKFGSFGYIPVIYYNSFQVSFAVPINALPGNYEIYVVNLYNSRYNPGQLIFSKSYMNYTIYP